MDDSNSNGGPSTPPRSTRGILAGQIERLGPAFRQRLARDRDQLEALFAAASAGGPDAASALRDLEISAHKLHGTAAMFGYEALGAAAGELEAGAHDAMTAGGIPADLEQRLRPRLHALEREIELAISSATATPSATDDQTK